MRWALSILLLFFSTIGICQNSEVDSLIRIIDEDTHDTLVALAYIELSDHLYLTNPDTVLTLCFKGKSIADKNLATNLNEDLRNKYSLILVNALNNIGYMYNDRGDTAKGMLYFRKSLAMCQDIGDQEGEAQAYNNIGFFYEHYGNTAKVLPYYFKSMEIYEQIGNRVNVAGVLNNIGYIYQKLGNISEGLKYHYKALKIREELEDAKGIAQSLNTIGNLHSEQGNHQNALECHLKALKISEEIGDENGVMGSLGSLATIYKTQGDPDCTSSAEICLEKGIKKALGCYERSLEISQRIGNKRGEANCLNNLGTFYGHQKNYKMAMKYLEKSIKIKEALRDMRGLAVSLKNMGRVYLMLDEVEKAKAYGERSLKIAEEIGYPENIKRSTDLLAQVHKKLGNYKLALEMYERHIEMRDSLNNDETQKAAIRQQTKYEFEKDLLVKEQDEKETARLAREDRSRRDNLQYSVILIAILILFGGVLSLGYINVSDRMAEGVIFFSFLILFEFLLVLADPTIEKWSGGAPGIKLLFNAGIAALIFPAHAFFERWLKGRLVKAD